VGERRPVRTLGEPDVRPGRRRARVVDSDDVALLDLAAGEAQLLGRTRTAINPATNHRFQGPRIIYNNRFHTLNQQAGVMSRAEYLEQLERDAAEDAG
jgi:hypothetical protein